MIIVGAKGFASEVIDTVDTSAHRIAFFDDVSEDTPDTIFDKYPVLRSLEEVSDFFQENGTEFTLGLGNPELRAKLCEQLESIGGKFVSTISQDAIVGKEQVTIGNGCNILAGAKFSNNSNIGKGCIVYYNVVITHDVVVGDFAELSPGATLLGRCSVGRLTHVGANATILPNVSVGDNCIIGAGAVVTKDVPDNSIAIGVPARITQR